MSKRYTAAGIAITAVYGIGLAYILFTRLSDFPALKLNELGDFLAGAFGPLAILWLVLGYFQQGIELRQNSDALHLQAEELKNSVAQQKQLVEVARDQYESDREALSHQLQVFALEQERIRRASYPMFTFGAAGGSHSARSEHRFKMTNLGASCSEVQVQFEEDGQIFQPDAFNFLKGGDAVEFSWTTERKVDADEKRGYVLYRDAAGVGGRMDFIVRLKPGDNHSSAKIEVVEQAYSLGEE